MDHLTSFDRSLHRLLLWQCQTKFCIRFDLQVSGCFTERLYNYHTYLLA